MKGDAPPSIFRPRADPHCRHCGFTLQGLADRGQCPECGTEYDPGNRHWLLESPTVSDTVGHFAGIVVLGLLASLGGAAVFPPLALLTVPLTLMMFGSRLRRYRSIMRARVFPPARDTPTGLRSLGAAAHLLGWGLFVTGSFLLVGSVLFFAVCVVRL